MSETLALYAGAIMANKITGGSSAVRVTQAGYCIATSVDDATRQMEEKCLEAYPFVGGYFDHAVVVMAIDHRAIAEVYEVK